MKTIQDIYDSLSKVKNKINRNINFYENLVKQHGQNSINDKEIFAYDINKLYLKQIEKMSYFVEKNDFNSLKELKQFYHKEIFIYFNKLSKNKSKTVSLRDSFKEEKIRAIIRASNFMWRERIIEVLIKINEIISK